MMPGVWVQLIIERAYAGEKDHVKHALDLFVDFAAIFVRILVRLVLEAQILHARTYSDIETVMLLHTRSMATTNMHLQVILIQKQQREEEARRRSKRRS